MASWLPAVPAVVGNATVTVGAVCPGMVGLYWSKKTGEALADGAITPSPMRWMTKLPGVNWAAAGPTAANAHKIPNNRSAHFRRFMMLSFPCQSTRAQPLARPNGDGEARTQTKTYCHSIH